MEEYKSWQRHLFSYHQVGPSPEILAQGIKAGIILPAAPTLDLDKAKTFPVFLRFEAIARIEHFSALDEQSFLAILDGISHKLAKERSELLTIPLIYFEKLWNTIPRNSSIAVGDEERRLPKSKRGRPRVAEKDPKRVEAELKLYRDWRVSGLTQKKFLRERNIPENDGLLQLGRGKHYAKKSGKNKDA